MLAIVFLRVGRAEMQAGTDALLFQRGHQGIARNAAPGFIHANNKQVPGVQMWPGRGAQRLERGIREFKPVAVGNVATALIGLAQLTQLDQRQRGVDIRKVVFEARGNDLRLRRAAVGLAVIGIYAQTVELQAADFCASCASSVTTRPPSAQVMFLMAWKEKIAVPCQPT